jgi:predicted PurR-regulated permease PerM
VTPALKFDALTLVIAVVALFAVLQLHLLPAFLAGLLVYELVHALAGRLRRLGTVRSTGKVAALTIVLVLIVVLISLVAAGLYGLLSSKSENLVALLQKMADALDVASAQLPAWLKDSLPSTADELNVAASAWLRAHARMLQVAGEGFLRALFHIIAGIVIGGLAALGEMVPRRDDRPLIHAMAERVFYLRNAFRRVVFAQIRISALNTLLTGLYLTVVLPALGITLPLTKTMIVVTFVAGLLPIVGNLISNSIIVIVSLSVSLSTAIGSLLFLISIHKLEYFVNARIIGSQIRARAWELLLAMLVMESAFGIPGVISAPIYYAYVKDELAARRLI